MDIQSIPGIEKLTRAEQGIIACIDSTCTRAFVVACQERDRAFIGAREEGRARIQRALTTRIDSLTAARVVHAERVRSIRASIAKKPEFLKRVLEGIPMLENLCRTKKEDRDKSKQEESETHMALTPFELTENDLITSVHSDIEMLAQLSKSHLQSE